MGVGFSSGLETAIWFPTSGQNRHSRWVSWIQFSLRRPFQQCIYVLYVSQSETEIEAPHPYIIYVTKGTVNMCTKGKSRNNDSLEPNLQYLLNITSSRPISCSSIASYSFMERLCCCVSVDAVGYNEIHCNGMLNTAVIVGSNVTFQCYNHNLTNNIEWYHYT